MDDSCIGDGGTQIIGILLVRVLLLLALLLRGR